MSKSKRFCSDFSSEEQQNNQNMKIISDYDRVKTRIPKLSAMTRKILSTKGSSPLALRRGIAPGVSGRGEPPKSTPYKRQLSPMPRLFVSRKYTSSLPLRSRIAAGSGREHGQYWEPWPVEPSKPCAQLCDERTETPCKAAQKSEKLYSENCSKSKPQPVKSSCCDAQEPRRESCVSFEEPVARDIPSWDPPLSDCPCSEPDHPTAASDSCEQEKPIKHQKVTHPTHKPHSKRFHGCCKRPVIVVPLGEGARKHHHREKHSTSSTFSISASSHHSAHKEHPASSQNSHEQHPVSSQSSHPHDHSQHQSYIPYFRGHHPRSSSGSHYHEQHHQSSPDTHNHEHHEEHLERSANSIHHCQEKHLVSCPESHHPSPHCSTGSPPCANCSKIADLIHHLGELNRKLEGLKNDELPEIRKQVELLNAAVKDLTHKCAEKREPEPACPNLERKSLNTCQFCQGRDLPLLNSFHVQLMDKIGKRSLTDVVMSVFLRADNIYHVNVRDLNSGSSLSCFLVTDDGIAEAQQLGLFRDILTFSVIDVRNTLKPRNNALGITFELVPSERQQGGADSSSRGICMSCKPFVARVLGLPLQKMKYLYASLENTTHYPEKSLRRFRNRIARIQETPAYSQAGKVIHLSGKNQK